MPGAPLVIDVLTAGSMVERRGLVVLVEPLYGCTGVALALDAGWQSVELADEQAGEAPIPLVSFEQRPSADRCRLRSNDLSIVADQVVDADHPAVLGCPANARPLGSAVARAGVDAITLIAAPSLGDLTRDITADGMWATGMLVRILLEELDDRPSTLTDAAGIAVTLAQGAEDPAVQLSAGVRWRRHLERGGHPDDLRVASAIDSVGVVPRIELEGDAIVARAWLPTT